MKYSKMNIKMSYFNIVTDEMRTEFLKLNWMRSQVKQLKRDTPEQKALAAEINKLRVSVNNKAHSEYKVRVSSGRFYNEQVYVSMPEPIAFKEVADDFINDIRFVRSEQKKIKTETKNSLGIKYTTTGGVFTKSGEVIEAFKKSNPLERIQTEKTPHPKVRANYLGFELELMCKVRRDVLNQMFINEKLAGYVYVKDDGSIRTEEGFPNAHEVTVLCREEDVESVMRRVCSVLNSKEVSSIVNNTCGFHLHVDMRNGEPYKAFNNLVMSLPLLSQMVPTLRSEGREANQYCRPNETSDLKYYYPEGTDKKLTRENRYQAINPNSISQLKTIEVRLHSGTTNFNKIVMWAKICSSIVKANNLTTKIKTVEEFERLVLNDNKVSAYMSQRINLFSKQKGLVDTKMDHTLDTLEIAI